MGSYRSYLLLLAAVLLSNFMCLRSEQGAAQRTGTGAGAGTGQEQGQAPGSATGHSGESAPVTVNTPLTQASQEAKPGEPPQPARGEGVQTAVAAVLVAALTVAAGAVNHTAHAAAPLPPPSTFTASTWNVQRLYKYASPPPLPTTPHHSLPYTTL